MNFLKSQFWILCLLVCLSCSKSLPVGQMTPQYLELMSSDASQQDTITSYILKPYRDSVAITMDQIVGFSQQSMERGKPESILGNFVSDVGKAAIDSLLISRGQSPTDLFIFNIGGLRGAFPQGEIKLRDVYQVMPFDNELVWVDIPYDSLLSMIGYIKDKGGVPIAGASMVLSADIGKCLIFSNQKVVQNQETYRIGTNDFLARGGDGMNMLNVVDEIPTTGIKVRDAILWHFQKMQLNNKPVVVGLDGRIKP